jgi:hypothetical protein
MVDFVFQFILSLIKIRVQVGWLVLCCLMPLSTIFKLYRGGQFYWWRKPKKTTDRSSQITDKLYHIMLIGTDCIGFGLWCLMPPPTIFQFYCGGLIA